MKIRIKDASIRLRLSMDDMEELAQTQGVIASCPIGPNASWEYQLSAIEDADPRVSFLPGGLHITIPKAAAMALCRLSTVGHTFVIENGTSAGLSLLVERDFKCLVERPQEDESRLYPNPLAK